MPLLLNNSTKQIENISDADVTQAIASGAYSPRVGSRLNVISATGDMGTIDAGEAQAAFTGGWQYFTRDQAKEVTDNKILDAWREEFDRPGLAFAAGALRGGTFGLSDVAARAIGGEEAAQNLRVLEELSPRASVAGEVAGTIGSLAIPGAPARAAASLGTKVSEATIGKLAAKYGANSVITRAAQMAAGTAVEGALFGGGEVISEAALGDPELSAQSAIATIGMGAAVGGAFGGLTKLGGEAYTSFKNLLNQSTLPTAAADTLGKLYSKVTSLTRGMDPSDAAEMERLIATREGRDLVFKATQDRSINENTMASAIAEIRKATDSMKSIWGEARAAARTKLSTAKVGGIRNTLNKQFRDTIDDAIETVAKKPEFYAADTVPALERIKSEMAEGFKTIKNKEELHQLLQTNRELLDSKMKFSFFERSGSTSRSEQVLQKVRDKFVDTMTDKMYFGQFAEDYKLMNQAYNGLAAVQKRVLKEFGEKTTDEFGKTVIQVSPQKISAFYRNPETLKNASKLLELEKLNDSIKYMEKVSTPTLSPFTSALDASHFQALSEVSNTSKKIIKDITDARIAEMFLNNLETRTGKSVIGTVVGAIAGTPGGLPGQVLGGLVGSAIATPRSFLNILFTIENHGIAGQQRLQNAVSKFMGNGMFNSVLKRVEPLAKPVTIKGALEAFGYENRSKNEINDLKNMLDEHVQDPQKMWYTFNQNNPELENVAPMYSQAVMNNLSRGLQFLQSKMPQQYSSDLFANNNMFVSDNQKRQIKTYVDAIFRPGKIYDDLEKGSIDPLTVEAIQNVYPALYANLQKEIMNQSLDSKLDYHKKLSLGKLFAIPTVPSLGNLNELQNSFFVQSKPQVANNPVNFKTLAQHQTVADSLQG